MWLQWQKRGILGLAFGSINFYSFEIILKGVCINNYQEIRNRLLELIKQKLEVSELKETNNLFDLCLASLKGTNDELNKPSPQDGLRPTDCLIYLIMLSVEEEFGITISDKEAEEMNEATDSLSRLIGIVLERIER